VTTIVNITPAALETADAAKYCALSETTMARVELDDPTFPRARQLSKRRVGYLVRELDEWLEARPVADNLPPPNTGHSNRPRPGAGRVPQGERQAA